MISHELKTEKQTMAADPDSGPGPGQHSRRHPGTAALHARDQTEHFEEAGAAHKPRGLLLFMNGRTTAFFWGAFLPHKCGGEEFCRAPSTKPNRANFSSPRRRWGTPHTSGCCRHKPGCSVEMRAPNPIRQFCVAAVRTTHKQTQA